MLETIGVIFAGLLSFGGVLGLIGLLVLFVVLDCRRTLSETKKNYALARYFDVCATEMECVRE